MKKLNLIIFTVIILLFTFLSCASIATNKLDKVGHLIGEWIEKNEDDDGVTLILTQTEFTLKAPNTKNSVIHGTFMSGTYKYIPATKTIRFYVERSIGEDGKLVEISDGLHMKMEKNMIVDEENGIAIISAYKGGDTDTLIGKWKQINDSETYIKIGNYKIGFKSTGYTFIFKEGEINFIYYDSEDSEYSDAKVIEKSSWKKLDGNSFYVYKRANNTHLIQGTYKYMVIDDYIQISFPEDADVVAPNPPYYEKQ